MMAIIKLNNKCLDIAGISDKDGAQLQIWSDVNGDNQKWRIEIDTNKDSDGDGLMDIQEIYSGTNPLNIDSDKDELTDYCEVMVTGTDPLKEDSDKNGKIDSLEDLDEDGLTCRKELELGTFLVNADTDEDGLKDGEEINIYKTEPLKEDTDGDGLNDGDEIKLGFDPLSRDTNNDGVLDNKEKNNQKIEVELAEEEKPEIKQIQVQMKADGNIENTTTVESVYQEDIMSSDVEGLIGTPVEITTESDFQEATITFYYDETLLGETEEDNLAIMWYDEENETYRIFEEESIIDTENNSVSYTTTHFSTYMVVDKKKWYEAWSKTINYRRRGTEPVPVVYYDFVYTVDCSGSMQGERMSMAKKALKSFTNAMLEKDRAAVVSFTSEAKLINKFTSDKDNLKEKIENLNANGGTDVNKGLKKSIEELKENGKNEKKCIILICDGDVSYQESVIKSAKENNIVIYTVLVGNDTNGTAVLDKIAETTGGESYYAETASEIRDILYRIEDKTVSEIDKTDTDGDGLYDTWEIAGMRLANGKIIYSNPMKADTDGDRLSDKKEMGGLKVDSKRSENGKYAFHFTYKSNPNKKDTDGDKIKDKEDIYPKDKKRNKFVYLDENKYKNKDYLPKSKILDEGIERYNKYNKNKYHNAAKKNEEYRKKAKKIAKGGKWVTPLASKLLLYYLEGKGDIYQFNADKLIKKGRSKKHAVKNINKLMRTCEQGIKCSDKNTVYISTAYNARLQAIPGVEEKNGLGGLKPIVIALSDIDTYLSVNACEAQMVCKCTYDKGEYNMEVAYYFVDYYDWEADNDANICGLRISELNDLNLSGLAKNYIVYGKASFKFKFKKGDKFTEKKLGRSILKE